MTQSTFADDTDAEPVSDDTSDENTDSEESAPAEGGTDDGADSLRREYPDYPAQDEGTDESPYVESAGPRDAGEGSDDGGGGGDSGGGGGGSDSGGGGGGPSSGATPTPADAKAADDRKKEHEKRKAERDKKRAEHKAEWEKKKQEHKDAVTKSIERNRQKNARPIPAKPIPVYQAPSAVRTAIPQTASVAERLVGTTPSSFTFTPRPTVAATPAAPAKRTFTPPRAPAPPRPTLTAPKTSKAPARKFGYEEIAWEFGESWGAPFDPTADGPYAADADESAAFGVLTIDDMVAIENYMKTTVSVTPEATKIKDAYIAWFDGLYWYQKTSQDNFDKARNFRNQFNLANAPTPEAKAAVLSVITDGLSKEQAQGDPNRRNSAGMYPDHPDPLIPLQWEIAGVVVAVLTLLVGVHAAASK